jgi:23S rRNA (adenine2503-C2)-methyltransferase
VRDTGVRPRISVIPYNRIDDDERDPFRRTEDERATRFRDVMREEGVFSHLRYSGGGDVGAACGQLATREAGGRSMRGAT